MIAKTLLAAAMLLVSGLAAAARDLPKYEIGQAFIFDSGRVEVVRGLDGSRVTWAARSGRTYEREVNPIVPILNWSYHGKKGTRSILGNPGALWPLASGRSVQFRAVNETRDEKNAKRRSIHLWTCNVGPEETLTVPAGRFRAFPLTCDRFSANSMRVVERLTWHYAPEVGHYVRREARNMLTGTRETYALYAALPARAANSRRIEALAARAAATRSTSP